MKPSKSNIPHAPSKLSADSRKLWDAVVNEFELDEHHLQLLGRACDQNDRALAARKIIENEGVTTKDRFGQVKSHPCIDVERNASLAFKQVLRELGLDVQIPETRGPRRPGTRS